MSYQLSKKSYFLSEIRQEICPLPCVVEDGFYGETSWDTVSSGETLLLGALEKRRRVLARSADQKYYSIPINFPLKFSVLLPDKKETLPNLISDILIKHQLPVTLKLQQKDATLHYIKDRRFTFRLDKIVVVNTYDEKYIVGNCIAKGVLQKEPILLPIFLKIRVRLIEGTDGLSDGDWKAVRDAWKVGCQHSLQKPILPPVDIAMFQDIPMAVVQTTEESPKTSAIYESLEPSAYVTLLNREKSRGNLYTTLAEVKASNTNDLVKSVKVKTDKNEKTVPSGDQAEFRTELKTVVLSPKLSSPGLVAATPVEGGNSVSTSKNAVVRPPIPPPKQLHKTRSLDPTTSRPSRELPPPIKDPTSTPIEPAKKTVDSEEEPSPDYMFTIEPREGSSIRSVKDIPKSIKNLNCDEVADCLRLLNMSTYIEKFVFNQIDGSLLTQLDESILTRELLMTPLHARKLIMFAQKDWRPT